SNRADVDSLANRGFQKVEIGRAGMAKVSPRTLPLDRKWTIQVLRARNGQQGVLHHRIDQASSQTSSASRPAAPSNNGCGSNPLMRFDLASIQSSNSGTINPPSVCSMR